MPEEQKKVSAEEKARMEKEEHDRLKANEQQAREDADAQRKARAEGSVGAEAGGMHPGSRPPVMKRDVGGRPTFPNVPKQGYKTNPANILGAQLPPERQAPPPEDPKDIGSGAIKGPATAPGGQRASQRQNEEDKANQERK